MRGEKWLVTLGDYVDRGPDSAAVIEHLLAPPPAGFRRIRLRGNHEQMMLDFLARSGAPTHTGSTKAATRRSTPTASTSTAEYDRRRC